jgi:hypothetical protein
LPGDNWTARARTHDLAEGACLFIGLPKKAVRQSKVPFRFERLLIPVNCQQRTPFIAGNQPVMIWIAGDNGSLVEASST